MSLVYSGIKPAFMWEFQGSNVDYVTNLSPAFSTTATSTTFLPTYQSGKYKLGISLPNTGGNTANTWIRYDFTRSIPADSGVTLMCWVNYTTMKSTTNAVVTLYDSATASFANTLALGLTTTSSIGYNNTGSTYNAILTPNAITGAFVAGVWYHLAVTFTSGAILQYVNGVPSVAKITGPTGISFIAMRLGTYTNSLNNNAGFGVADCMIDDLRIFDSALTSFQINAIYATQGMPGRGVIQALTYSNIKAPSTYAFSSQVFSNAQATSNIGPTQYQLNTEYPSLAPTYLTSNTGVQTWTVPVTAVYSLVAAGAAGGNSSSRGGTAIPGNGVIVRCEATFQKNQVVSIIVGQQGLTMPVQTTSNIAGGGGGGSFIVDYATRYLYIAAGGGGGCSAGGAGTLSGYDASFYLNGVSGGSGTAGGTSGRGAPSFQSGLTGNGGGGGGGFLTNGGNGVFNTTSEGGGGGKSVLVGGQGGLSGNVLNFTNGFGGFGGGGGGGGSLQVVNSAGAGGGGGGGYSGGSSGVRAGRGGGGGGSYVPLGQTMSQLGLCTSNGYVSITYNRPVTISLTGTPLLSQLSPPAIASAVGAFSLRAVNGQSTGGTARAVNVAPGGAFPIAGFSTAANNSSNEFTQTLAGYPFTGSYVANCSTFYSASGTEQPWRCFDKNNNGTWWTTSTPSYSTTDGSYTGGVYSTTISGSAYPGEWIQIKLPVSVTLLSYTIYISGFFRREPVDFKIAGSNDGTNWTLVDTQTSITSWGPANLTFVPSTQTIAYSYYRLCVNICGGGGSGHLTIGELVLNGTVPSLAQDFYADRLGNLLTAPVVGQTLSNWLGGATGYVTTWYDQSGKGNHASQSTAANQPIIKRATKGPGYACLFNGAQGLTGMSYTVLNGTNYSVVINERRTTLAAENYYIGSGNGATNNWLILGYRNNINLTHAQFNNDYDMTVPFYAGASEPIRYTSYTFSSTNGKFTYNNGSLFGSRTDANGKTGLSSTSGNFTIGSGYKYYIGEIYELLVFTQSLYDLDNTGGLITQVYQNQLSAYGT